MIAEERRDLFLGMMGGDVSAVCCCCGGGGGYGVVAVVVVVVGTACIIIITAKCRSFAEVSGCCRQVEQQQ